MSDQDVKRWTFYNCNNENDAADDMAGMGVVDDGEWLLAADYDTMKDAIRAYFVAAEFENVDEMLSRFTVANATKVGETVAARTKALAAEIESLRGLAREAASLLEHSMRENMRVLYDEDVMEELIRDALDGSACGRSRDNIAAIRAALATEKAQL